MGELLAADITKPILAAIEKSRAALMLQVDHLASESTLMRNDLDKIGQADRGRGADI